MFTPTASTHVQSWWPLQTRPPRGSPALPSGTGKGSPSAASPALALMSQKCQQHFPAAISVIKITSTLLPHSMTYLQPQGDQCRFRAHHGSKCPPGLCRHALVLGGTEQLPEAHSVLTVLLPAPHWPPQTRFLYCTGKAIPRITQCQPSTASLEDPSL